LMPWRGYQDRHSQVRVKQGIAAILQRHWGKV